MAKKARLLGEIAGHICDAMDNKDLLAAQIEFEKSSCSSERRRKPGSDLVLILISFRDGFRGSFAGTVLSFAATCVS